jgi:hypothetical protein
MGADCQRDGAALARCGENILAISAEKYKKEQKKAVRQRASKPLL